MNPLAIIILAAGKGTRMKSDLAKVLHPLCGRPIIAHVVAQALRLDPERVVIVVGHQADRVRSAVTEHFPDAPVRYAEQKEQLGTGHAVLAAKKAMSGYKGPVLILSGDVPLLAGETMGAVVDNHAAEGADLTLVTFFPHDSTGYGRVLRDAEGSFRGVVEHKDADEAQLAIGEVSSGIFCVDAALLFRLLDRVRNDNAQAEYYLPDIIPMGIAAKKRCATFVVDDEIEVAGVNDRAQLAELADIIRSGLVDAMMRDGVGILDPATTFVDLGVSVGPDTVIYPQVNIHTGTVVGRGCVIGAGSQLFGARVGDDVVIHPYTIVVNASIENGASVGPFAYVGEGSRVGHGAMLGRFTDVVGTDVGAGVRVNALSHLVDADIGAETRIGAGVLTCRLGAVQNEKITIGQRAFIGSDTVLVSPVEIGNSAHVGSASVVTRDVPDDTMVSTRSESVVREDLATRFRRIAELHGDNAAGDEPRRKTEDVSKSPPKTSTRRASARSVRAKSNSK